MSTINNPSNVPSQSVSESVSQAPSRWQQFRTAFVRLCRTPAGFIGVFILSVFFFITIFGPAIAPFPFTEQHYSDAFSRPNSTYWFGTDQFGRDIFSRVLVGARNIMVMSFTATFLGLVLGISVGLVAGYFGGLVDEILMRAMDVMMSFPSLLLALLILSVFGTGLVKIIIGIGLVFMPRVARVLRSVVLDLKTQEFVDAAKVRGESAFYIMTQEILPNAMGPITVEASIRVSYAILLGASLGYLGLGVQPPSPDWGLQVSEGKNFIYNAPWVVIFPSIAIAVLVIGINLLADGLRSILNVSESIGGQE